MKQLILTLAIIGTVTTYAAFGGENTFNTDPSLFNNSATDGTSIYNSNSSSGLEDSTGTGGGGLEDSTGTGGSGFEDSTGTGGASGRYPKLPDINKPNQTIAGFVSWFVQIMQYIVIAMLTASLLVFLYGIFILMFWGGTKEESRSQGRKFMLWGIVSLFVMVSVWGIVNILKSSVFGGGPLTGPTFKI